MGAAPAMARVCIACDIVPISRAAAYNGLSVQRRLFGLQPLCINDGLVAVEVFLLGFR